MAGGIEPVIERGADELSTLNLPPSAGRVAVDLGAGFGMPSIPLARQCYQILALDSWTVLPGELRVQKGDLPIQIIFTRRKQLNSRLPRRIYQ